MAINYIGKESSKQMAKMILQNIKKIKNDTDNSIARKATKDEVDVERKRIDSIIANDGTTTGDLELQDIRVDVHGNTYGTAGNSIRKNFENILNFLNKKIGGESNINFTNSTFYEGKWKKLDYRCAFKEYVVFDYDVDLSVGENFRLSADYIVSDGGVSTDEYGNKVGSTGWVSSCRIPAGTSFRFQIARSLDTEDTTEKVPVEIFLNELKMSTKNDESINILDSKIDWVNVVEKTVGVMPSVYIGLNTQTGTSGTELINTLATKDTNNARMVYKLDVSAEDTIFLSPKKWKLDTYQTQINIVDKTGIVLETWGYNNIDHNGVTSYRVKNNGTAYVAIRFKPNSTPKLWNAIDYDDFSNAFMVYGINKKRELIVNTQGGFNHGFNDTGVLSNIKPSWNGMLCIHQGWSTAVGGTLQSFWDAKKNGYSLCECDVRRTSDGVLVIVHDESVTGIVDGVEGTYVIADTTWETLSKLKFKGKNYGIPRVYDALKFAQYAHVRYLFDIKVIEPEVAVEVLYIAKRFNLQDDIIFNCNVTYTLMDALVKNYEDVNLLVAINKMPNGWTDKYLGRKGMIMLSVGMQYINNGLSQSEWDELSGKGYVMGVWGVSSSNLYDAVGMNPSFIEIVDNEKSSKQWYNEISKIIENQFDVDFN